jgi:hypothetical protein
VRVVRDGRTLRNVPVPPGATVLLSGLGAGVFQLSCQHHAGERSTLVVVDHPYAARTDAEGRFALRGVPPGDGKLSIVRPGGTIVRRPVSLSGTRADASIQLIEGE